METPIGVPWVSKEPKGHKDQCLVPPSVHMSDEGPDHASMARPVGTGGPEGNVTPPPFF